MGAPGKRSEPKLVRKVLDPPVKMAFPGKIWTSKGSYMLHIPKHIIDYLETLGIDLRRAKQVVVTLVLEEVIMEEEV
jgi:hypothetical protein